MSVRQNCNNGRAQTKNSRSSSRGFSRGRATTPPRRQSNRVRNHNRLPTPASSPSPSTSPSRVAQSKNMRHGQPQSVTYTTTMLPMDDGTSAPTVNWDCVSYVVSDQKIISTYSRLAPSSDPSDPSSYRKLITKTVTMTVTTTIATTEILHPGDEGYEESLERQQTQSAGDEERYADSRKQAAGNKDAHEAFHACHHRAARPADAATAIQV